MSTAARLAQPRPTTAGYILAIAVGTGVAVTGALLPAQLSWWWLDTVAHVAGGGDTLTGAWPLYGRWRHRWGYGIG